MLAEGSVFDQLFTRDALQFLRQPQPDPFYMVLSLINPHDICKVLGGKVKSATIADAIFFCRDDSEPYLRGQMRPQLPESFKVPPIPGMYPHQDYMYEELHEWTKINGVAIFRPTASCSRKPIGTLNRFSMRFGPMDMRTTPWLCLLPTTAKW